MFDARLSREGFEDILNSLFLVNEALVNLHDDEIKARVVDSAKVAKAQLRVDSSGFDRYEATAQTLGLDLAVLRKVVKRADQDEDISVEVDNVDSNLEINISGQEYFISLIDPTTLSSPGEWPSVDFDATAVIPTDEFQRAVSAADMFSDEITLHSTEEGLSLIASGDDNKTRTRWTKDELVDFQGGNASATFALHYFEGISEAADSADTIKIRFGDDWPIHVEFEILEGSGEIEFYIAPRIKNN